MEHPGPGLHDAPQPGVERAAEILGLSIAPPGDQTVVSALDGIAESIDRLAAAIERVAGLVAP